MAYSNTPEISTYRTVQVKFDATSTLRSADNTVRRDSHIINFFYDRISQENKEREVLLTKRPGVISTGETLGKASASSPIKGYHYNEVFNLFFWATETSCFVYEGNTDTLRTIATISGSAPRVGFGSFQKSTGETYVLFSDGASLFSYRLNIGAASATAVSDPDMPTPHVPDFVVLNGTVYLAAGNTIFNSDTDTFDIWTAGNEIDAEMSADDIRILFQNKNYLVAMGFNSLEVFWDAANATGTPLARNDSAFKSIGYIGAYAQTGDIHYFVGQNKNGNISVYRMDGFKVDPISNSVVERSIQASYTSGFSGNSKVGVDTYAVILQVNGHTFYCLNASETTWVYDTEEKLWYEWRSPTGILAPEASWGKFNGAQYIANSGSNTIDIISPLIYQDKGVNFTCSYTTEDNLFGSVNWKVCNRATLVADRQSATGTSNLVLQWSDNDWTDNPTNSVNLNVFANRPRAHRLGRFFNRSFRLLYTDNYPLRMRQLELELNIGTN